LRNAAAAATCLDADETHSSVADDKVATAGLPSLRGRTKEPKPLAWFADVNGREPE
jgi:hypothetical protein